MSQPPEEEDRTVYQPKRDASSPPSSAAPSSAAPSGPAAPPPEPPPPPPPPPRAGQQQIADGTVLNGIYRITRFIARGGMGEVYEAVNIHQPDDRVAVKVMLQHLAEDELVAAMFAKEGSTLTRLHHEAIAPYRLAARDTEGRPFIVTEFIPGPRLEDRLGELKLTDAEFLAIAQKLAAGLGTAHMLGAIHRDIAPDNILLLGGDPARPKIIDFGIAKDVRESSATIVGDGFAGKLGYVAPEQLGEYGRNVGPWTDIYSLALTLRAVLAGKRSDMGGSMADAVRKRMTVPDLGDIPPPFRSAFEAALQPDPALRPQSMAAFNLMLTSGAVTGGVAGAGGFGAGEGITQLAPAPSAAPAGPGITERLARLLPSGTGGSRLPLLIGGGAAALIAVVGLVIAVSLGGNDTPAPGPEPADDAAADAAPEPAAPQVAPGTPAFASLAQQAAASIPCSWLTLSGGEAGAARFNGAAAAPTEAQTRLGQAFASAGVKLPTLDFANVLTFPQSTCAALDALREARGGAVRIATPQTIYEVRTEPYETSAGVTPPRPHAKVLLQVTNPAPRQTALMFFYDYTAPEIMSSDQTAALVDRFKGTRTPDGVTFALPYIPEDSRPQHVGVVAISSERPLPANITTFDAGWPQRFREGAKANGWQVDAVWFRVEDRQPG